MTKILITGGAGGIGSGVADICTEHGYDVAVFDKNIPDQPHPHISYKSVDLSSENEVQKAFVAIQAEITLLVICAGVMRRGSLFLASEEDYAYVFDNNVKTAWLTLKCAQKYLASDATVVMVSSFHAMYPEPHPGLYTIAKKATAALAEAFELSYPAYRVKIAYPGPVKTELLRQGRNEAERQAIEARAISATEMAEHIIRLIDSPHRTLQFAPEAWDYVLE